MEMHKHFTLRLQSSLNLRNAFHGRTMGALALTWKAKRDSVHCTVEPERITSSRNRAHIGPTRTILHNCEAPEIGRLQTACHRRGTKNPLNL
jgi:4-aminobutyrate aminotransferase-like enzyme